MTCAIRRLNAARPTFATRAGPTSSAAPTQSAENPLGPTAKQSGELGFGAEEVLPLLLSERDRIDVAEAQERHDGVRLLACMLVLPGF
jgi:hypothetical protein